MHVKENLIFWTTMYWGGEGKSTVLLQAATHGLGKVSMLDGSESFHLEPFVHLLGAEIL